MDNPVDNIVDLGLINYVRHPDDPNYVVFRIQDAERAESFEEELKKQQIWFERGSEQKRQRTFHLFGIHKSDFKRVEKINFVVEAKHKKPLIPFKPLRYFVLFGGLAMLSLAIIGYCEQQKKLEQFEEVNSSDNQ
ncbi:MAG: hypothetical protein EP333_06100 [Bacteroidetes bacterium]|nr:MAG: hypothetical protein EP333_06100 [Bacteroidota bacterium]